jgi:DNA replication licensing factor MCM7
VACRAGPCRPLSRTRSHRLQTARGVAHEQSPDAPLPSEADLFPAELRRRYEVRLIPVRDMAARSVREIKAKHIGQLVKLKALVTRVSDVKPLVKVVTYTCDECGFEIYQEVTARQFMPICQCPSASCKENKRDGVLHMQTRGSKFVRYQELRVQEIPSQVPVGHIPRTVVVIARGQLARAVIPGETVTFSAVYTPTPYTGFRAMKAGLIGECCWWAWRELVTRCSCS